MSGAFFVEFQRNLVHGDLRGPLTWRFFAGGAESLLENGRVRRSEVLE